MSIDKTHELAEGETSVDRAEDPFDYILTVTNNGTREADDVVVTDALNERIDVTG